MKNILFLGYGNPDRGDDGAAWHILKMLLSERGIFNPDLFDMEIVPLTSDTDLWFNFQLLPEIADLLVQYKKAVFLDAHKGDIKNDLNFQEVKPAYHNAPFTHHLPPESLLALAESIYGYYPHSWLISVRGYVFDFERKLTSQTLALCNRAVTLIKENFL